MKGDMGADVNVSVEAWKGARLIDYDVPTPHGMKRHTELRGGKLYESFEGHNLVTTAGLNLIRDWFYGAGEYRTLRTIGFGSGVGTTKQSDTWLKSPFGFYPFTKRTEESRRARVMTYVRENEYNGYHFAEYALLTGQNREKDIMFARVSSGGIEKKPTLIIAITWDISFSIVGGG